MAERLKIFVIASIQSAGSGSTKYRCVAAYHVPRCEGAIAISCLLRFLAMVKHGSNRDVIESETNALQDKFRSNEDLPTLCCPFITFLMAMCWSTRFVNPGDVSAGYSQYSPFDESVGSIDAAERHQQIAVIDLSEVRSPMYCFVDAAQNEENAIIPSPRVPLSARQYMRSYTEDKANGHVAKLDNVKLINLHTLVSVWPKEYKEAQTPQDIPPLASKACDFTTSDEVKRLIGIPVASQLPTHSTVQGQIPTIYITPDSRDAHDIEQMEELWQAGNIFQVYSDMQELSPFPLNGTALLHKCVEEKLSRKNGVLSLAKVALRDDHVEEILNVHGSKIRRLDLSYNSYLTIQIVPKILQLTPNLSTLTILGCRSISNADIYQFLRDNGHLLHSLEALLHPALFQPLELALESAPYPIAFSYIRASETHGDPVVCTLPLFQPAVVIRAILDLVSSAPNNPSWQLDLVLERVSAVTPASLFSGFRQENSENREVTCIPQYSLRGLHGEGWVFAVYTPQRVSFGTELGRDQRHRYAFVRFKPSKEASEGNSIGHDLNINVEGAEIYTFRSWLDQLELEGFPEAPVEMVQELHHRLLDLQLDINYGLKPMLEEDLCVFVENLQENARKTMCRTSASAY